PERWSRFLPPDDVKSRLQSTWEKEPKEAKEAKGSRESNTSGRESGHSRDNSGPPPA
ncbi:YihY/virulence factor BrkB family protein, partial [Streptomyces sp. SID8455]|nr:YihY/virulence factor BrkB family protein [Streptomyces sp. SID8455]